MSQAGGTESVVTLDERGERAAVAGAGGGDEGALGEIISGRWLTVWWCIRRPEVTR